MQQIVETNLINHHRLNGHPRRIYLVVNVPEVDLVVLLVLHHVVQAVHQSLSLLRLPKIVVPKLLHAKRLFLFVLAVLDEPFRSPVALRVEPRHANVFGRSPKYDQRGRARPAMFAQFLRLSMARS
jgi:hypothetical protein